VGKSAKGTHASGVPEAGQGGRARLMQQLVMGMATICARNTVSPIASGARICQRRAWQRECARHWQALRWTDLMRVRRFKQAWSGPTHILGHI